MKKTIITTLIIVHGFAACEELPADAAAMLEKLAKYESDQLEAAKKRIDQKKILVIESLKTMLDRETRAGNLENAVGLKAKITALMPEPVKPEAKPKDLLAARGERWEGNSPYTGETLAFETQRDGSVTYFGSGNSSATVILRKLENSYVVLREDGSTYDGGWELIPTSQADLLTFRMAQKTARFIRVKEGW